eukprot:gene16094-19385_t
MPELQQKIKQNKVFDKIFKENMQATLPGIIEHILQLRITWSEELKDDVQYTKERKTDLLKKVKDAQGEQYILHIEYQKKNESIMVYRMAEYSIMLQRKHRLPVKQFVIYIGQGDFTMSTTIQTVDFKYRYNLVSLSKIDYRLFLKSEHTEQKLLAILGDPGKEDPKQILKQIVMDIKNQTSGELLQDKHLYQLHVLVQLRNLENQLEEIMVSVNEFFNIEKDPIYIRGEKKGIENGIQEGIQKGLQQGLHKKALGIALELKKKGMDNTFIAEVTKLSAEEIENLEMQGEKKGIENGIQEGLHMKALGIALEMKKDGMPLEMIIKFTGLTAEEIDNLEMQ